MHRRSLLTLILGLLATALPGRAETPVRPTVTMVRAASPPVIDGVLDDPVWATAAVIDDFTQAEPVEGAAPSERTEVRLLFDRDNLYLGFRCFDREPERIVATTMIREGSLSSDDRVRFTVGPFFDRRNGFYFEMNPVGAKVDGLVGGRGRDRLRLDWDGIWQGRATVDGSGWVAEFAIPYKTMSLNPDTTRWEFNTERIIRRRSEVVRWAAPVNNKSMRDVADAGILEGLVDLDQGLGLDIVPYATAAYTSREAGEDGVDLDAGLDIFKKLSPSTTLALTFNTDFAETEVDARRINLTRFPLFFPEKRDFFLQDASIFTFGGINREPLPFFSRRIGISGGEQKDILAGVRLTGREGRLNFGLMDVQMKDDRELGSKNLAVGRVAVNVLEESTVGLIATAGDPRVRGDNYLVGGDFNFRNSRFGDGGDVVTGHLWYQQTFTDNADRDDSGAAYGAKLSYPNDRVDWSVGLHHIDDEFNPALGFAPRPGTREFFGSYRYRWRPADSIFRTVDTGVFGIMTTTVEDDVESEDLTLNLVDLVTHDDDRIGFEYSFEREVLVDPFEISEGVVIPTGDYRFQRWGVDASTSGRRPVSLSAGVGGGEFFGGTRLATRAGIDWRVSSNLFLGVDYEQNHVDLPEGDFTTRLVQGRVNVYFSPDLSWTSFIQYDNVSESVGLNSRVRWIVEPGSEVFVVLNQAWGVDHASDAEEFWRLTTKVTWTLRF